jgi:hypothetical protein
MYRGKGRHEENSM